MASLLRRLAGSSSDEERSADAVSFQQYVDLFSFAGHQYQLPVLSGSRADVPDPTFLSYVNGIHRKSGVVSAAAVARSLLLSQVRFTWRKTRGAPDTGDLFANYRLGPLERPGSTTRSTLLYRASMDACYAGNSYIVRRGTELYRLRPDFVRLVLGSDSDPEYDGDSMIPPSDAREIGIIYQPRGGPRSGKSEVFLAGEYAHWMPEPDPVDFWRGESWVTSVLREVVTDTQVVDHQSKFFENAATPNVVMMMDPSKTPDQVREFRDAFNERYSGVRNAYRNWFLGGGTDVKVIGSTLANLALADVQGGFDSRVAARSRVPAVVLGIREGLGGSALNSGNYGQTRRLWVDGWFTPTVQNLCACFETLTPPPIGAELWYDSSEVRFLREDEKDAAEILNKQMATVEAGVRAGYTPKSVVDAVNSGDLRRLEHTGLFSVQLQPPGTVLAPDANTPDPNADQTAPDASAPASTNGSKSTV